ncbi:MAG: ABC transporter substrate-binding protein [Chloroflexi bacterium]|nr:ABC transporter substrate-binding protein [Chloroflexota bacterium]
MIQAKRWRGVLSIAVLAMLVAAFAVACSGADDDGETAATPQPTQPSGTTASPIPATQPPAAGTGGGISGTVTYAVAAVNRIQGLRSQGAYTGSFAPGSKELLFRYDSATDNVMFPNLAESWRVEPDGSKVTIELKTGIPWQTPVALRGRFPNGFGDLDAEDVVWYFNQANVALNPQSSDADGGDYAAVFRESRVIDATTFEMDLLSPIYFALPLSEFGPLGAHGWFESKKVFDALGADEMFNYSVGTGPYAQDEWIANERGSVVAIEDHWQYPNDRIERFNIIQVPEENSRIAMLQTGQADMAPVGYGLVADATGPGKNLKWIETQSGGLVGISVGFSGNLYEEKSARDGSPLDPWNSPAYEQDLPWIGNPWCDRGKPCKYNDSNNPSGMSDMEQARLVRWAMSYAMDRQGIVAAVLGGLGTPLYSEYIGPEYPNWDPSRTITKANFDSLVSKHGYTNAPEASIAAARPNEAWPWEVPYDPNKAKELLTQAGFPNGFDVTLNAYRAELGDASLEVADAITGMWTAVGIRTTQSREDYGAVISQRMRLREQSIPVLKNGDVHSNVWPSDFPYPPVDTSLSRPGWGMAFESDILAGLHKKIRGEQDRASRVEWARDTVDYIMYWQLYAGVVQAPKGVLAGPRILSWSGRTDHYSNTPNNENPAYIKLAQ